MYHQWSPYAGARPSTRSQASCWMSVTPEKAMVGTAAETARTSRGWRAMWFIRALRAGPARVLDPAADDVDETALAVVPPPQHRAAGGLQARRRRRRRRPASWPSMASAAWASAKSGSRAVASRSSCSPPDCRRMTRSSPALYRRAASAVVERGRPSGSRGRATGWCPLTRRPSSSRRGSGATASSTPAATAAPGCGSRAPRSTPTALRGAGRPASRPGRPRGPSSRAAGPPSCGTPSRRSRPWPARRPPAPRAGRRGAGRRGCGCRGCGAGAVDHPADVVLDAVAPDAARHRHAQPARTPAGWPARPSAVSRSRRPADGSSRSTTALEGGIRCAVTVPGAGVDGEELAPVVLAQPLPELAGLEAAGRPWRAASRRRPRRPVDVLGLRPPAAPRGSSPSRATSGIAASCSSSACTEAAGRARDREQAPVGPVPPRVRDRATSTMVSPAPTTSTSAGPARSRRTTSRAPGRPRVGDEEGGLTQRLRRPRVPDCGQPRGDDDGVGASTSCPSGRPPSGRRAVRRTPTARRARGAGDAVRRPSASASPGSRRGSGANCRRGRRPRDPARSGSWRARQDRSGRVLGDRAHPRGRDVEQVLVVGVPKAPRAPSGRPGRRPRRRPRCRAGRAAGQVQGHETPGRTPTDDDDIRPTRPLRHKSFPPDRRSHRLMSGPPPGPFRAGGLDLHSEGSECKTALCAP